MKLHGAESMVAVRGMRGHACMQASWLAVVSHNRPGTTFPHVVWVQVGVACRIDVQKACM